MIYFLICIVVCLILYFNVLRGSNRPFKFLFFLIGVALILFAGLRYRTGYDYDQYEMIYKVITEEKNFTYIEPLFTALNYLCYLLFDSFGSVIFLTTFLAVCFKFRFVYKYSTYWFVSIALYFVSYYIPQEFGQFRQGVAVGICLLAFDSLLDKKWLQYSIMVVIATLIHYSALIFIFAPLAFKFDFKWGFMLFCWFLCFIMGHLFLMVTQFLLTLDLGPVTYKLQYITNPKYNTPVTFSLGMIFKLFILIATKLCIKKDIDYKINIMANIYFLGGCIYFLFGFVEVFAGRFSVYYIIFEIILLPFIISRLNGVVPKFVAAVLCSGYILFLLYVGIYAKDANYLPYITIFDK